MKGYIRIGDYVYYLGNFSVSGPLREPGVGKVLEFHTPFEEERIRLFMPDRNTEIWCDYKVIRVIETSPDHLNKLGFTRIPIGSSEKYEQLAVTLSQTVIPVSPFDYRLTGLCVADFSQPVNFKKYMSNGNFSMSELYKDFPYVGEINRLLDFLESTGRQINRESIIL